MTDDLIEAEANALWQSDCSEVLIGMLQEALERPADYQAFIAGLMLRYGLILKDASERS